MFHVSSDCPYKEWASVAKVSCDILEQFHFLRDEYGNVGGVCSVPIWVENGRCPVYNNKAKKLDTFVCLNRTCPSVDYRSNQIHVDNYCRYPCNHESSTVMPIISQNEGNQELIPYIFGFLIVLTIFVGLATFAICVYIRKRKSVQKKDEYELEYTPPRIIDETNEFSDESRQLVIGKNEKTNEMDASRNNNSYLQPLISNKFANAKINHQTTEPNKRQNGIYNKDQLNGPFMEAMDFSDNDDIYKKSQQNQQCLSDI